jgi:CBS domain-containing protein
MSEIMNSVPGDVDPAMSLDEVQKKMLSEGRMVQTVRDSGTTVGLITVMDIKAVKKDSRARMTVGEVMRTDFIKAHPGDEASKTWKGMIKRGRENALVMRDGKVVGIVTMADFRRIVDLRHSLE